MASRDEVLRIKLQVDDSGGVEAKILGMKQSFHETGAAAIEANQGFELAGHALELLANPANATQALLQGINGALIAVGGPAAAAFGGLISGAVELGEQLETGFVTLERRTGAVGEEAEGLKGSFSAVFPQVEQGASEVGGAMAQLAIRTGLTGKALQDLTILEANLAEVTGADLGSTVNTTTQLFAQWKIPADAMGTTLDFLLHASQASGVSIGQLGGEVVNGAALFQQFGFSMQDSVALLAQLGSRGVEASTVLTGLRTATSKFDKAGITDFGGALQDVFSRIREAGTDAEAAGIAIEFFGARAGPRLAVPIRQGVGALGEFRAAIDAIPDSINVLEARTETFSGAFAQFVHGLDVGPLGQVGAKLLEVGKQVVESRPLPVAAADALGGFIAKGLTVTAEGLRRFQVGAEGVSEAVEEAKVKAADFSGSLGPDWLGPAANSADTLGNEIDHLDIPFTGLKVELGGINSSVDALGQKHFTIQGSANTANAQLGLTTFDNSLKKLFPDDKRILSAIAKAEFDKAGFLAKIDDAIAQAERDIKDPTKLQAVLKVLTDEKARIEAEGQIDQTARPRTVPLTPVVTGGGAVANPAGVVNARDAAQQALLAGGNPFSAAGGGFASLGGGGQGLGGSAPSAGESFESFDTSGLENFASQTFEGPTFQPQAEGSPKLSFTDYFSSYAPGVLNNLASSVPELTFGADFGGVASDEAAFQKKFGASITPTGGFALLNQGLSANPQELIKAIAEADAERRTFQNFDTQNRQGFRILDNLGGGFEPGAAGLANAFGALGTKLEALLAAIQQQQQEQAAHSRDQLDAAHEHIATTRSLGSSFSSGRFIQGISLGLTRNARAAAGNPSLTIGG